MKKIVQGVLDYRDLDYREFAIPGSIKNSIYNSNSSIIGILIIGEHFLDLVITIIEDPLYVHACVLKPCWEGSCQKRKKVRITLTWLGILNMGMIIN